MTKKELLLKQANELYRKAKELEAMECQKIGKLVLGMYEKSELKDANLISAIAKILGDDEPSAQAKGAKAEPENESKE